MGFFMIGKKNNKIPRGGDEGVLNHKNNCNVVCKQSLMCPSLVKNLQIVKFFNFPSYH